MPPEPQPSRMLTSETTNRISEILRELPNVEMETNHVDLRRVAEALDIDTTRVVGDEIDPLAWSISYDTA